MKKNSKKKSILDYIKNTYFTLVSSNVFVQLAVITILFLGVFFGFKYALNIDSDLLFKEMTDYEPADIGSDNQPLKLFYIIGVVFFSGLLVMVLTNAIRNRVEKIIAGEVRYKFSNHVVIFGYSEIAKGVIENLSNRNNKQKIVLVVENNVGKVREEVVGLFGIKSKIYLEHANRTEKQDLISFNLHLAKEIFIIGENEINSDYRNLECYNRMSQIKSFQNWSAYFYLYLQDPSSITLVSNRSYEKTPANILDQSCRLRLYNTDERWARRILVDSLNEWPDMNLNMRKEKRITMDSQYHVHLVIFGMSNSGEMVAKVAAQTCHHPNFVTRGIKTKITVIDEDFQNHRGILSGRYSEYMKMCNYTYRKLQNGKNNEICKHSPSQEQDFLDIEWEFIECIPDEPSLQEELASWCEKDDELLTVVVCNSNENKNVSIALGLPKAFYDNSVPVWLYVKSCYSLNDYLENSRYDNIVLWGMQSDRPTQELWEEALAKKLNYFYATYDYDKKKRFCDSLFDDKKVEKAWESLPVNVQMNSIAQMAGVPSLVGSLRNWSKDTEKIEVGEEELEVFSELEQIRWSTCMLLDGFRSLTREQKLEYDAANNKTQLRRQLRKNFYHPAISRYENLDSTTQQLNRETIKFYISTINPIK